MLRSWAWAPALCLLAAAWWFVGSFGKQHQTLPLGAISRERLEFTQEGGRMGPLLVCLRRFCSLYLYLPGARTPVASRVSHFCASAPRWRHLRDSIRFFSFL